MVYFEFSAIEHPVDRISVDGQSTPKTLQKFCHVRYLTVVVIMITDHTEVFGKENSESFLPVNPTFSRFHHKFHFPPISPAVADNSLMVFICTLSLLC